MSQQTLPLDPPTHLILSFHCGHFHALPVETLPADLAGEDWEEAKRLARAVNCLLCPLMEAPP